MKLIKRKRDGIYLLEMRDERGKRRRLSTGQRDRGAAEREAQLILAGQGPRAQAYTLNQALEHAWQRRWKDQKGNRQLAYVMASVQERMGHHECRDLTYSVLEEYAEELEQSGLAAATINHRLGCISVALDLAAKRNRIASVPPIPRMALRNRRLRYLTHDEEAELLQCARGRPNAGDAFIMTRLIKVLVDTGARLSEITGARPEDITPEGAVRLLETKNGGNRTVPLTQRARVALRELHAHEKWQSITLRVRHSDVRKASAKDWCVKQFTRVRNDAALHDVSLHTLRHTCASRLVQAGVDLYRVKAWLGHSTITMTERYAHLAPSSLTDMADVLEPKAPAAEVVDINQRRDA